MKRTVLLGAVLCFAAGFSLIRPSRNISAQGRTTSIITNASDPATCTAAADMYGNTISNRIKFCTSTNNFNSMPVVIASGTASLPTSIASGACASASITGSTTGVASTDAVYATFNSDPTSITGYAPSTSGTVYIYHYVGTNVVGFKSCNNTSSTISPGAATLNWVVIRP